MDYIKDISVKDYFEIHNYYSKKYGKDRTIVLMQVGSFHEAYCSDIEGLDLVSLSQELDIHLGKKNGNNPDNARMMGFPIHVTDNYIDKLIDMNYTVVKIDQTTEPPNPKRKVVGIYSPATRIEKTTTKSSFLVSIILDKMVNKDQTIKKLIIGLSSYDLSTGNGSVYECYSISSDTMIGLDDAIRFLENYPPREIVLENNLSKDDVFITMKMEDILSYLNIEPGTCYNMNSCRKIAYQTNLLESVYKLETNVDIIELIGLKHFSWATRSLVMLLDYVQSHQPNLLKCLKVPTFFSSSKYLYLGNRAMDQLDVSSLLPIINYTKTPIGKRFLNTTLSMPLIDNNELNKRYNTIQKIIDGEHAEPLICYLEDIYDLDKLIRKLEINIISPNELYQLYISFYNIIKMIVYMKENKLTKIFEINNNEKLTEMTKWVEKHFILEKINGLIFNNNTIDYTIYNNKIHDDIDKLQESIEVSQNFMTYLIKALEVHVDDPVYFKKNKEQNVDEKTLITIKYNDRDGHYLMITNRRCEMLKKNLAKIGKINVGNVEVKYSDLEFSELPKSSNTKINCKKIKEISLDLVNYRELMGKKLKETFKADMIEFCAQYSSLLSIWSKKIAYIDFINSGALCAKNNHYSKPIITMKEASFFKAKEMRHPIVEKISTDTVYVPHNIELGYETEQDGILLYGINSSGKSTLMKSIGLNIIMAQIGYYNATTSFEFCPYASLFTRICGNDNMFKGMSSFMVEMMELMAILKRNNMKTLVLGDELAKGTEMRSGIVIVSYMLETLAKTNTSFITASHLHDINKMEGIKKLERVKTKHLKITYDDLNDRLIYERDLLDGQGETFYGLQVAKYLMKDKVFNERTSELLKEYDNINIKNSRYNTNVIMTKCHICESTDKLESHHIVWQKDFKDGINESKFYLQKNDSSNLTTLCMSCHDKVDSDEIVINGWIQTSSGRVLDYKVKETPKKKSKYSEEFINFIISLKEITNNDMNKAKIEVCEKFKKKISIKTISSYW